MDEGPGASMRVVLVNYRSIDSIHRLFESGALRGCTVTVVDNGDDPAGTIAVCQEFGAAPLLLPVNIGFAAAVNRVVEAEMYPTEPWLLLNPDIEVTADQLAALRDSLKASGADAVSPLLELPDGTLQVGVAGGPVTLWSVVAYFLFLSHLMPWIRGVFFTRRQSRRIERVDWLCMACLMLTPDAFARFGPIPEDELVYAEDVAWGTLATMRGAYLCLVPSIAVGHKSGASGGNWVWSAALERLCRRRMGRERGMLAVAAIRVGLAIRRAIRRALPRGS